MTLPLYFNKLVFKGPRRCSIRLTISYMILNWALFPDWFINLILLWNRWIKLN